MTTDFRALCVELTDCLEKADWPHRYKAVFQQWMDIARAALAEADGPAVPEGREPASVVGEPSDTELLELMPETMRDEFSYAAKVCADATGNQVKPGIFRVCLNTAALEYARAVLARWGHEPAPPAEGEVAELVAEIRHFLAGYRQMRGRDPEYVYSIHRGDAMDAHIRISRLARAADLLEQRHPEPVPASERLPGP